jgi:hypothetical protein
MEDYPTVVIAKMDGTANEVPGMHFIIIIIMLACLLAFSFGLIEL